MTTSSIGISNISHTSSTSLTRKNTFCETNPKEEFPRTPPECSTLRVLPQRPAGPTYGL